MNKSLVTIKQAVMEFIENKIAKLSDTDYVEVLEEIQADVDGMIDCKKEELDG